MGFEILFFVIYFLHQPGFVIFTNSMYQLDAILLLSKPFQMFNSITEIKHFAPQLL
mgnify:CR=1 FL=1